MTATVTIRAASKRVEFTKTTTGTNDEGEADNKTETCIVEAGEQSTVYIHDAVEIGYIKEVKEEDESFETANDDDAGN